MDVTLLRTLTLKSTMKFGKYQDLTVRNIIELSGNKGLKYLTWIYYSASKISYVQEILDLLGITEENEIEKPGKIPDGFEFSVFVNNAKQQRGQDFQEMTDQERAVILGMERKRYYARIRHRKAHITINNKKIHSKGNNMRKSQIKNYSRCTPKNNLD